MNKNVVTVTLNPAIDLTGNLERLCPDSVNVIQKSSLVGAGKGINVAKVLADLNVGVTATGFLGRENESLFIERFTEAGITDAFIRVDGSNRTNVKVVSETSQVTDINFPGFEVDEDAITRLEQRLSELARHHDYFIISGSLPRRLKPERVARWIGMLQESGKFVAFDSSKQMLSQGITQRPWMIKPNEHELGEYLGYELQSVEECARAALQLAQTGIEHVVVSMGEQGVLWVSQGECLLARPPQTEVVSTVGAGDTLVAGFCFGALKSLNKRDHLAFTTALATLAVRQTNVGVPDPETVRQWQSRIQVEPIEVADISQPRLVCP